MLLTEIRLYAFNRVEPSVDYLRKPYKIKPLMSPLVSIGIPNFNRAEFLKDSLSVALSQSYPNIEVIVSDNASIDHT